MRIYDTLEQAIPEIQRDVYKGSRVKSSRVQQWVDKDDLSAREVIGYSFGIRGDFPETPNDLVDLGSELGFRMFIEQPDEMSAWLTAECAARLDPSLLKQAGETEKLHPALSKVIEGAVPSYTYPELLMGSIESMVHVLRESPDSRRAYWPIFRDQHALRAWMPTRIPCSIGYHAMLRQPPGLPAKLVFTYLQRSADFDTFFLTDIWLARQFQVALSKALVIEPGLYMHNIISLHSFQVEGFEIY